jgi:hypothetical protein
MAGESVCGGAPRSVALHERIAATRIVKQHQPGTAKNNIVYNVKKT